LLTAYVANATAARVIAMAERNGGTVVALKNDAATLASAQGSLTHER
jgi:hypothetical protein